MAGKFKKEDLVGKIAEASNIAKAEAERQLNNVIAGLEAQLSTMKPADKLQLVGVLSIEVKHKKAYMGKNPRTQVPAPVPASNRVIIKAGKGLVDLVQ